jgi:NADH dehydrogenase [ubiquinone] 1 alpha subcomplex assembly factor 5
LSVVDDDFWLCCTGGIEKLIMMDTSYDMIKSCRDAQDDSLDNSIETSYFVGDEEFLPVKESSVDLIISSLGLHWTNDLPGSMIQVFSFSLLFVGVCELVCPMRKYL